MSIPQKDDDRDSRDDTKAIESRGQWKPGVSRIFQKITLKLQAETIKQQKNRDRRILLPDWD